MILGVVSTSDYVGVALWKDGALLGESILEARGGVEELPGLLDGLLGKSGVQISGIQKIGIVTGPGSYSGLRGAIAFVQGLALPRRIPTIPFHTLDVIADEIRSREPLMVIMDGAPRQFHVGLFSGWDGRARTPLGDPLCIMEGQVLKLLEPLRRVHVAYSGRRVEFREKLIHVEGHVILQNVFPRPSTLCDRIFRGVCPPEIPAADLRPEYGAPLLLREFAS